MMEALRFPWGSDDETTGQEVAPSTFKPHQKGSKGRSTRPQATMQATRRPPDRHRMRATRSRFAVATTTVARGSFRPAGHASRETARDRVPGRVVQGPQRERHERWEQRLTGREQRQRSRWPADGLLRCQLR